MKILVWHESLFAGGADWSLIDLIHSWPDRGDSFVVFVNKTHEGAGLIREKLRGLAEVREFDAPIEGVMGSKWSKRRETRMLLWGAHLGRAFLAYRRLIESCPFDVFLLNNGGYPGGLSHFVALAASARHPGKRLMIVRNYPAVSWRQSPLMRLTRRLCIKYLDGIAAVSESLRQSLVDEAGLPASKVVAVHNGISIENKGKPPGDIKTDSQTGVRVGVIGTLEARKGHDVLFRAWKKVLLEHPSARLRVVGSSKSGDKQRLLGLAGELGIERSIDWTEFTSNVGEVYSELDVVAMPSQSMESFGRVVVEAMAYQVPVVASRVGGIPELISHEQNGFLFERTDSDALAALLSRLVGSSELRRQIAQKGLETYRQRFTAKRMAEDYRKLCDQLVIS